MRDPQCLWDMVHRQGYVDVAAKRMGGAVLGIVMMVAGPIVVVFGLIALMAELGLLGALMMLISGVVLAVLGFVVFSSAKQSSGPVWRVDCVGIAVDGVGPIPWGQLMPPERRWVPNPRDDGNLLSTIMPLTGGAWLAQKG